MRILVTGAAGYIGSALVKALAGHDVIATDQSAPASVIGNLAYPPFARSLITPDVDVVFHLASLVSGGAEQSFELGMKVNLDATRDLLEACRLAGQRPKFIFTSSIAVYSGAREVTDETPPAPRLSYGAQKLVCEILIEEYTRRGYVQGCALRLPTVMVRPGGANTAVSGWASAIIREPLAGRDYVCPVRPDTRMACISVGKVVAALLHAQQHTGTVLLTGIPVRASEMWDAVKDKATGKVRFEPDPSLQAIMDRVPQSTTSARAAELGFPRSLDIQEIVREYDEAALAHHG
jgi:nucleoside-diphosphate-sugar epimerase